MLAQEEPPWLRGNPQPKSGVRGTALWSNQRSLTQPKRDASPFNFSSGTSAFEPSAYSAGLTPSSLTNDFYVGSDYGAVGSPGSVLQHNQQANYKAELQKQMQDNQLRDQRQRLAGSAEIYDPFGKGGGGAPLRDRYGNTLTDRRQPTSSRTLLQGLDPFPISSPSMAPPYSSSLSPMSTFGQPPASEKEQARQELLVQIEERKRQKELEKRREREEEERDRARIQRDMDRMRREEEDEKTRRKQKLIDQEAKQAAIAERTRRQHEQIHNVDGKTSRKNVANDGLEWWERAQQRGHQPQIATITPFRNTTPLPDSVRDTHISSPPPTAVYDTYEPMNQTNEEKHALQYGGESEDKEMEFRPSSAAVRNEGVMRQLSAMRERLAKEQLRVKSAIGRREYGNELFSDDESESEMRKERSIPANPKQSTKSVSLLHRSDSQPSSDRSDSVNLNRSKKNPDDPNDVVSVLRNTRRFLDSAASTRTTTRTTRRS